MTTKALTTVLVVHQVSKASLTSIPYGLIVVDANRLIRQSVRISAPQPFSGHVRTDCIAEAGSVCSRACLERQS